MMRSSAGSSSIASRRGLRTPKRLVDRSGSELIHPPPYVRWRLAVGEIEEAGSPTTAPRKRRKNDGQRPIGPDLLRTRPGPFVALYESHAQQEPASGSRPGGLDRRMCHRPAF